VKLTEPLNLTGEFAVMPEQPAGRGEPPRLAEVKVKLMTGDPHIVIYMIVD
jgi:hypothetical protein